MDRNLAAPTVYRGQIREGIKESVGNAVKQSTVIKDYDPEFMKYWPV